MIYDFSSVFKELVCEPAPCVAKKTCMTMCMCNLADDMLSEIERLREQKALLREALLKIRDFEAAKLSRSFRVASYALTEGENELD
jgi:hypothetical protein